MKFLYYISWLPFAILNILASLTAYPLVPIAVLLSKDDRLPWLLRYLETHDEPLCGDGGHVERWASFVSRYPTLGWYCQRVAWLWRNKAYKFSYYVTGRDMTAPFEYSGNPNVESGSPVCVPGYVWITTGKAWCLFAFIPWLKLGNYQFYIRIYLGWKLKKLPSNPDINERAMLATFISPFRYIKK